MDDLIKLSVCKWYRYVDDTFVFVNSETDVDNILAILNNFHSSIKFTRKIEAKDRLEFLDIEVIRSSNGQHLETTIYRKSTFTGLIINWNSYVPIEYKKASIVNMVNRALIICSTYALLGDELDKIRIIGLKNGYPPNFIDTIIGIKLSKYHQNDNEKLNEPLIGCDKQKMYVELPFIQTSTLELKKRIKHLSNKLRPNLDIIFFNKPTSSTQTFFQTKDSIAKHMKFNVVYYIKCTDCTSSYIGKTERQAARRLFEHGAPKTTFERHHVTDDLVNNSNTIELRRSSRIKNNNKTAAVTTTTTLKDNDNSKTYLSSITQHEHETGHHMDWSNFLIIGEESQYYRLLIKESLMIKAYEPELNKTTHSVPLLIFPDGLHRAPVT